MASRISRSGGLGSRLTRRITCALAPAAWQYSLQSAEPRCALSALICINAHPFNSCLVFFMISFTYRCPRTGQNVYGHVANDLIGGETYEPVTCTECGRTHLVNLMTGELLEEAKTAVR
jgi:hypothetical protein